MISSSGVREQLKWEAGEVRADSRNVARMVEKQIVANTNEQMAYAKTDRWLITRGKR